VVAAAQSVTGKEDLVIFPNPVSDKLTIRKFAHTSTIDISIYNILGEKIYAAPDFNLDPIDCKLLSSGLYFLEVKIAAKVFRVKFSKE